LENNRILVYVQAIPSTETSLRNFSDLETCDFVMTHSSRVALAFANSLGFSEIVAAGFSPVLNEALARGATKCHSMPLCDDPIDQLSFFPRDNFSNIIVGENLDWVFSGASLCGVIMGSMGFDLAEISKDISQKSVVLVPDSGEASSSIDTRRINFSFSSRVNPEGVLGDSTFSKSEIKRSELIVGSPSEIASTLSRRIKRLVIA